MQDKIKAALVPKNLNAIALQEAERDAFTQILPANGNCKGKFSNQFSVEFKWNRGKIIATHREI